MEKIYEIKAPGDVTQLECATSGCGCHVYFDPDHELPALPEPDR
ncbi:hypothetical protein [uncultured Chitinophaga sp.]|jgi:hypothetical protein|nr:hypothetical protein [uncultured Chitinophaga sp.]